jgi:hypothetical protein
MWNSFWEWKSRKSKDKDRKGRGRRETNGWELTLRQNPGAGQYR